MKLLIVAPDFHPTNGGYANACVNLVRLLSGDPRGDLEIDVFTPAELGNHEELNLPNVRIHREPMRRGYARLISFVVSGRRLAEKIRSGGYDFVLIETFENAILSWIALSRLPQVVLEKLAVRLHATTETEVFVHSRALRHRVEYFFARKVARKISNILVTTGFYIDFLKQHYFEGNILINKKNFGVLGNVVEAPQFLADRASAEQGPFLILGRFNGQGMNQKNFGLVGQAVYILKQRYPKLYVDIAVDVVGDGDRLADFQDRLEILGISDRFHIKGRMPNAAVVELQSRARAVILVSRYEGQSMFALEALAAGAPLILSANTGSSDMVRTGENGFLVDADDPYSLAEAMRLMMEADVAMFRHRSTEIFRSDYASRGVLEKFREYISLAKGSIN